MIDHQTNTISFHTRERKTRCYHNDHCLEACRASSGLLVRGMDDVLTFGSATGVQQSCGPAVRQTTSSWLNDLQLLMISRYSQNLSSGNVMW
jgi:hypothetical protein